LMSVTHKLLAALAAVALLLAVWLMRYEVYPVGRGGDGSAIAGYVLDRWTGDVELLVGVYRRPTRVEPAPAHAQ
jgi:hypothetical protein